MTGSKGDSEAPIRAPGRPSESLATPGRQAALVMASSTLGAV